MSIDDPTLFQMLKQDFAQLYIRKMRRCTEDAAIESL